MASGQAGLYTGLRDQDLGQEMNKKREGQQHRQNSSKLSHWTEQLLYQSGKPSVLWHCMHDIKAA